VLDGEPFIPTLSTKPELVLLVGYPGMGKSRLYRKHFEPAGYEHINQDILGTRRKCINATEEALAQGKSCVIGANEVFPLNPLALLIATLLLCRQHEQGRTNTEAVHQRCETTWRPGPVSSQRSRPASFVLRITFLLGRCFQFENSIDLAWHNNMYRTYCLASSTLENEVSEIV